MPNDFIILLSAVFGLIVGSFLNVVINRTKLRESFNGRSHCPKCKHELNVLDLFPVLSFLVLGGRCRYCGAKISWQYPLVETITALVFGLLAYTIGGPGIDLFFSIVLASFLIVIAIYDFKHFLILDKIVFPGLVIALIYALLKDFTSGCMFGLECATISGLVGMGIIAGFFFFQHYISKGRWIGFGDVKLGLLIGMIAGFPLSLFLLFLAYMSGAFVGVALIAAGKKEMGSKLPFGTFLAFSAIITMLWGNSIFEWYLNMIGI